jgi:predicted DCC family thiol-disulfide oxidoreductase YuxK
MVAQISLRLNLQRTMSLSIVVDQGIPRHQLATRPILFDGVCVLCSRGCSFVSKRDRRGFFRFVPTQLAEGRLLAEQIGINPDRPDSFAFVANGRSHATHCARASALAVAMAPAFHPTSDPRRDL